jgi:hypothetical protein
MTLAARNRSFVLSVVALIGAAACSASPATGDDAPQVAESTIDPQDEGATYGGWTQYPDAQVGMFGEILNVSHTIYGSGGGTTRGGGACLVQQTGSTCTSDTTCTTEAVALYGVGAYGYCYQTGCFARPGVQSALCALNPNRASGSTISVSLSVGYSAPGYGYYVVGCMTKTAGPNVACGGTNTSLYMRTLDYIY